MELLIKDFGISDVNGEKADAPYIIPELKNMYIEGGNIHSINFTPEAFPVQGIPDIEIRGGQFSYFKYGTQWIMEWFDSNGSVRRWPVANALGLVSLTQDTGDAGTYIYRATSATSGVDACAVLQKAGWIAPCGVGKITEITNSPTASWGGIICNSTGSAAVVVGSDGNIYRTADSGGTWTKTTTTLTGQFTGVAGNAALTTLVACKYGGQIWLSVDSGATWTVISSSPLKNYEGVLISEDGTRIFAYAASGVYWSVDSGTTWSNYPTWTWTNNVRPTGIAGNADLSIVYISRYGERAWKFLFNSYTYFPYFIGDASGWIDVCFYPGYFLFLNAKGEIWSLPSTGATMTKIGTCPDARSITASSEGIIFVCINDGLIRKSADNGSTWTSIGLPNGNYTIATNSNGTKAFVVSPGKGTLAYTSVGSAFDSTCTRHTRLNYNLDPELFCFSTTTKKIYKSLDNGVTWTVSYDTAFTADPSFAGAGWEGSRVVYEKDGALLIWNRSTWTLYSNGNTALQFASAQTRELVNIIKKSLRNSTVEQSRDWGNGCTWSTIVSKPMYAGSGIGLKRSVDGGSNWTTIATFASRMISGIWISGDGKTSYVSCSYSGSYLSGIFKSTDYGATWTQTQPDGTLALGSIQIEENSQTMFQLRNNIIYKSVDDGATFSSVIGNVFSFRLARMTGVMTYVSQSKTVHRSINYGASWLQVLTLTNLGSVCMSANGQVQYLTENDTVNSKTKFYRSVDYGLTWASLAEMTGYLGATIQCSNSGKYLYVHATTSDLGTVILYKSTDFGASFTTIKSAAMESFYTYSFLSTSGDGKNIVICERSVLYLSIDAGATWTSLGAGAYCNGAFFGTIGSIGFNSSLTQESIFDIQDGVIFLKDGEGWEPVGVGSSEFSGTRESSDGLKQNYITAWVDNSGTRIKAKLNGVDIGKTLPGNSIVTAVSTSELGIPLFSYYDGTYYRMEAYIDGSWVEIAWVKNSLEYVKIKAVRNALICHNPNTATAWISVDGVKWYNTDKNVPWDEVLSNTGGGSVFDDCLLYLIDGTTKNVCSSGVLYPDYSKIFTSPLLPDGSVYIPKQAANISRLDSGRIQSAIPLELKTYQAWADEEADFVSDIADTETMQTVGVFYSNKGNRNFRISTLNDSEVVQGLWSAATVLPNNDMLFASRYIEQFGSRLAMANVIEELQTSGNDLVTNGTFESSLTGWTTNGTVTRDTTVKRTGTGSCKIAGAGSITQTILANRAKLQFYAYGDISLIQGDYEVTYDASGWFRFLSKGYTSGTILINKVAGTGGNVYIDDVTCIKIEEHPSSIYLSDALNYQDFDAGTSSRIEIPANSEDITGIMPCGGTLYVVKNDATATISETGDFTNPFAVVEAAFPLGGKYPVRFENFFAVIREENDGAILLVFDGQTFQHINPMWASEYTVLSVPKFVLDKPIYSAKFGNKIIISQNNLAPSGSVLLGGGKVGDLQIGRIVSGEYFGEVKGLAPYERYSSLLINCGSLDIFKKARRLRVFGESNGTFDVTIMEPPVNPLYATMTGNDTYGLNFSGRRLGFKITPVNTNLINQLSLTYELDIMDNKR